MKAMSRKWAVALTAALAGSLLATSGLSAAGKPAAKSKYGGDVTVGIGDTYGGFCVANIPNHSALGGFRLIYEQLFERSASGEYVPSLASAVSHNDNFTQWTIDIRPGITFTNGEKFDADAAKLNIDLNSGLYNAQNATANAGFAAPGKGYASTGYGVNANIINVAKTGDLQIRIDLDHPQSDFLGVLYRAGRYVMRAPSQMKKADGTPNNGTDANSCGNMPIGTGPFKIQSWGVDTMTVVKNDNYWRTNPLNGDKLPYLDSVTFTNVKEPSQRAAAVRKGTVQIASFSNADGTFVKDLLKRKSVVTGYQSKYWWYGSWVPNVNKTGSIFKFKNCRLAVAYAIDWKKFNEVRYKGLGQVSGSIVTKGHPMFSLTNAPKYDAAKAKEYVGLCKTDLGGVDPGWSLYADTSSKSQNDAKFLQKYLEDAGFKMAALDIKEAGQHIIDVYANSFGVTQKTLTQGTPAEGGDSAYVSIFYGSSAFPTGHKSPVAKTATGKYYSKVVALSNVDDPKIDELIYAAQAADPKVAPARWKDMTAYLQAEGYQIPTLHGCFYTFVNKKAGLAGIGKLPIVKGKTPQIVTNKGLDLTGVYYSK